MQTPAQDSAGPRSSFLHTRYRAHFDRKLSHLLRLPPPSERAIAIGKDGHLLHVSPRWAMAHTTLPTPAPLQSLPASLFGINDCHVA